jgi:transcriptional regulator with XRE-family HTH domain
MMRGDEVRDARVKAGYSQQELADIMRVSRMTIYNWEHEVHNPSKRDMEYLERVLLLKK